MKKNEILSWVVYAAMLGIAIGVGLGVIRPLSEAAGSLMNPILLLIIALIVGVIGNAIFIELGHIIGAKIGGYNIYSVNILFFCFAKNKDTNKMSFSFRSFDGLTGETLVYPKDVEKNKPQAMVYMPLVFFLIEAIVLGVLIGVFKGVSAETNPNAVSWDMFCTTILTVGAIFYFYMIFPASLDNKNDGYLLTILTNRTNRIAYNQLLLGNYQVAMGLPVEEIEVYDVVTDFTYNVNDITFYRRLEEGKIDEAIAIAEKAILSEQTLSDRLYREAVCQKLSLLLLKENKEEGEKAYKEMSIEAKKYASLMGSAPALRAHLLISGLLDKSYQETIRALDASDRIIRKAPSGKQKIEEKLILEALSIIAKANPDWDFSAYNLEEKKEEEVASDKEENSSNENKQ